MWLRGFRRAALRRLTGPERSRPLKASFDHRKAKGPSNGPKSYQ